MRHLDNFASPVAALAGVLALAAGCASAPPPRSGLDQQYLAEEMDRELELRAEIDRVCERRTCTAERRREVLERCSAPKWIATSDCCSVSTRRWARPPPPRRAAKPTSRSTIRARDDPREVKRRAVGRLSLAPRRRHTGRVRRTRVIQLVLAM
ncbi:MAG: hypothetical protein RLP09_00985, partial [Sandaracinaceae bacterium]